MLNDGGQRKFTEVAKRSKNGITGGYRYNPSESFLIEEKILENEWVEQNYFFHFSRNSLPQVHVFLRAQEKTPSLRKNTF